MFLKNWHKAVCAAILGCTETYIGVQGTSQNVNRDFAHSAIRIFINTDYAQYANLNKLQSSFSDSGGVVIGTGITAPQNDDYRLSGEIISGFSYMSSIAQTTDENGGIIEATYTITNTSDSDFTIGEIGLIANLLSTSKSAEYKALLERTVLEEPVTVPAGGVGQITYTIRMNYPAA